MSYPAVPRRDAVLSTAFLEDLIKRSEDAEQILHDCGRLRLQRAALAAVELYLESTPPGGVKEVR